MTEVANTTFTNTPLAELEGEYIQIANYGTAGFYNDYLCDDKGRVKFIKLIVSTVRKCPEYARYRNYLIENLDMARCSILSGLDADESKSAGLEIHHAPLALYDIAELVLGQMLYDNARITIFAVANRVMAYHWKGYVGLVPLTETLHQAVHAGQVLVDPRSIYGKWQNLIMENRNGLTEHLVEKIRATVNSWENLNELAVTNAEALSIQLQQWTASALTFEDMVALPELPMDDGLNNGIFENDNTDHTGSGDSTE